MRIVIFFRFALLGVLALLAVDVRADLSAKQARKLISRMAGFELPNSAVRVKEIIATGDSTARATAEVQTVFRLEKNEQGRWRLAEIRTGPDQWEILDHFLAVERLGDLTITCASPDLSTRGGTDPSPKRARCLVARLLDLESPSDAVRIKSVSPGLSLASHPSALVEALIQLEFTFGRNSKAGWEITGVRGGHRDWISPDILLTFANAWKRLRTQADLEALALALEKFRQEREFYIESESHAALIDHLSPRYISRVIRFDPWHKPYQYRGERDHFTLRSLGPDRMENTTDDIVISGPKQ